jgi:hypothetical protein
MSADQPSVKRYLEGLDFPVTRREVIRHARDRNADEKLLSALDNLPDIEFQGPSEVTNRLGLR